MRGQLWQECRRRGCENDPVCSECELCDRHCDCQPDEPKVPVTTPQLSPDFVTDHDPDEPEEKPFNETPDRSIRPFPTIRPGDRWKK